MNVEQISATLGLLVTLTGIAIWWYWLFRPAALDWMRQDLFRIRSDLFLEVAEGRSPFTFDDPAYRYLRETLNAQICYADIFRPSHVIGWQVYGHLRALRLGVTYGELMTPPASPIDQLSLNSAKASVAEKVREQAGRRIASYLIKTSPLMWLLWILIVPFFLVREFLRPARRESCAKASESWKLPVDSETRESAAPEVEERSINERIKTRTGRYVVTYSDELREALPDCHGGRPSPSALVTVR